MSHAVESWEDDESFALPSNDFNPIRISSASSYSSAGVLGGDEDDDEDWGVEDFGGRVGAGSFKLGVPSGSGGGGGIGGWGTRSSDAERDGFDAMDDEDEDDRTDTLKAGQTTIRLPPPSSFQHSSSSSSNTPTLSTPKMTGTVRRLANQSSISSFVIPPDVDIEDGFSLPTSLSNLNLRPLRSQSSRASFSSITITTSASNSTTTANSTPGSSYTWGDTPSSSSSTNSGGAATGGGSFSRKSNGTASHPRLSAPSPSSSRVGNILHIPFSPPSLVRSSSEAGDHPSESSSLDFAADASEDADDLDGIVLSDPLFFSRTNDVRLQALLDAKGKGHTVPVPSPHHSSNANSSRSGKKGGADNVRIVSAGGATDEDMSFEAGLVIDDDVPITMGRLGRVRSKARNKTLPLPKRDFGVKGRAVGGSGLGAGGTVPSGRVSTKEDWEKDLERERGWGRTKSPNPPPVSVRETFRQPDDHHPFPSPSSSSRPTASTSTRPRPPQSRSATAGSLSVSNTLNSSPPGSSLRVAKSHARINLGHGTASSSSLHPSSAAPPSPSPHQQPHYPGSHAASLLSRKSSLPMLFANEQQERSSTPSSVAGSSSGGGTAASGRFAAPTAASLARQRDRIGGPDLFNPPNNSSTTSPPTSSRPSTPSSPLPLSPSMATVQPFHQRLTMPTSSSRQKTRPAITPHLFSTGSHPTVTTTAPTPNRRARTLPKPELVSMPKKKRQYGDGTELDGFDDLKVDREKEGRYRVGNATGSTPTRRETKPLPSSSTSPPPPANPLSRQGFLRTKLTQVTSSLTASTASTDLKRKKPTTGDKSSTSTSKSGPPRAIKLIRYMGDPSSKVVRQMRYNPKTLRWEGNESALQAFEGLSSSARPLLIAHHTGKSTTSLSSFTTTTVNDLHFITTSNLTPSNSNQSNLNSHHPGSPVSAISLTAKVVGKMWFDPERMKWIHMGGLADEEEEDVFAGMDDEDEVELALKGSSASGSGSIAEREEKRSSSRARRIRESGASSNSGTTTTAMDLDDFLASEGEEDGEEGVERKRKEKEFARRCRLAEEGHRAEVAGWGLGVKVTREREETRLWEIRRVAMRTGREREGSSRN